MDAKEVGECTIARLEELGKVPSSSKELQVNEC
jgi:hypothetical protein